MAIVKKQGAENKELPCAGDGVSCSGVRVMRRFFRSAGDVLMMRLLLSTTAVALVIGGAAGAGTLIEPLIEPEVIETATHSSSVGVVVPILLLLAVALAIGGGGVNISDRRLKEDIRRIGTTRFGLPLYRFRYKGVNYRALGLQMRQVA